MPSPEHSNGSSSPSASGEGESKDPRLGSVIAERYRIFSLLGEGGMGKVYLGEHVLMHKRVAIKILHRELTNLTDVVKRFEREAMAAGSIDHPNVAGATDFGKLADGSVFLVLEYVQGISLRSEIAEGAFGLVRSLHVARQIASALLGAHARGIVHRDLKPENVMLVEKAGDPDFVKVLDFGIAKVPIHEITERGSDRPGHVITKVGMVFGTPEYMAPEQALAQDVDGRADQFALGVILYEMLTGYRPYRSGTAVGMLGQQLQGPPPTIAERAPHLVIPPGVEELCARLLASEREKRFDSCRDVVAAIEEILLAFQPAVLMRGSRPDASTGPLSPSDFPPSSRRPELSSLTFEPPSRRFEAEASDRHHPVEGADERIVARPSFFKRLARRNTRHMTFALVGGLALGAAVVLVSVWFYSLRSPETRAFAKTPRTSGSSRVVAAVPTATLLAPEVDLVRSRAQGTAELERLAQRYPTDYRIVVEIAKAQLLAGDCGACLGTVARALVIEPKAQNNAEIATLLWKSVQKRECVESAFKLLEGAMATRGADILYDLSVTPGVKKDVKTRATEFFSSGRYERSSSPALVALIKVRDALNCEQQHQHLEKVLTEGDARALSVLFALDNREGCGDDKKADCYPCLRQDDLLQRAIDTVQRRGEK
jgi:serine/threonine-protein kinase